MYPQKNKKKGFIGGLVYLGWTVRLYRLSNTTIQVDFSPPDHSIILFEIYELVDIHEAMEKATEHIEEIHAREK